MCAPLIPMLAVASAVVGAAGSIMQGQAAGAQAKYSAQVNEQNAKLAAEQANDATIRGQEEAKKVARQYGQLGGQQRAAMGANGIDLGFGSALDVQRDTQLLKDEDLNTVYKNADRERKGYFIESANYRAEAEANRMQGKAAKTASFFEAGSTLLGGFSQFGKLNTKYGSTK